MKILVAPDSFKGTYSAPDVAAYIAGGVRDAGGAAVELPVADGGEGTYEILCAALSADPVEMDTCGPWRDPVHTSYALTPDGTAVIGLAAASGIMLPCSGERSAVSADTYGTGLLMADAARRGATTIVVAAGGSATTDGGAGAISAIEERGGLCGAHVVVLNDVTTAFEDAATVFAPQKGADREQVQQLTTRLHELALAYPRDPRGLARSGAAGGFSGGMWAHYSAELVSGADYILDAVGFDRHVAEADAVVVGEGRLDSQTGQGKIISAIMRRSAGKPLYAVVGSVDYRIGEFADAFAGVLIATDGRAMEAAGRRIHDRVSASRGTWSPPAPKEQAVCL